MKLSELNTGEKGIIANVQPTDPDVLAIIQSLKVK